MFIKLTRSKGHNYAQLVESFRDANGQPRQRTVVTLGRVNEAGGQVERMLMSLLKARGQPESVAPAEPALPAVSFDASLAFGDVWALDQLWRELGFDSLSGVFRRARFTTPVELAIKAMVFNRLCDADSKLGVLRWLETVSMPGVGGADGVTLTHQQLLRSMDALMDNQAAVDDCVAHLLRPLIDSDLSVVFYDLTTIKAQGLSQQTSDVRKHGMAKSGLIERQFMLGVVQTACGLPIYHEVFDGNTAEVTTLKPTLAKVLGRYPHIKRLIVVADRGLLSIDNLDQLAKLQTAQGQSLEFILAVPGRRYGDFVDLLQPLKPKFDEASQEVIEEATWKGHRLVTAHAPDKALEQTTVRKTKMAELEERAKKLSGKLDGQDAGQVHRGRKLSDSGAKARFFHEVSEQRLANIIKVDMTSDLFRYEVDTDALERAQLMDGKLLLVSNVKDMSAQDIVSRYKSLADIERGFRVLKSEIEIAPVFHRLPERIKAHASICFVALILHRVMRQRLKAAKHDASPDSALAQLKRIQRHSVRINGNDPITGITNLSPEQSQLLAAMNIKKPTKNAQMNLL